MAIRILLIVLVITAFPQPAASGAQPSGARSDKLAALLVETGYKDSVLVREAKQLWTPMAASGDRDAKYYLAQLLVNTSTDPTDDYRALLLMVAAAEQGNSDAQFHVASELEGVNGDLSVAIVWYERAAAKCHLPAYRRLLAMYDGGQGGYPADPKKSKYWKDLRRAQCMPK